VLQTAHPAAVSSTLSQFEHPAAVSSTLPQFRSTTKISGARSSFRHAKVRLSASMRIIIVTDAWSPQTNGVVRTLAQTAAWLGRFGHDVKMLTPHDFHSIACPTYPEIRMSLLPP